MATLDDDYMRELSTDEQALCDAEEAAQIEERRRVEAAERDLYFSTANPVSDEAQPADAAPPADETPPPDEPVAASAEAPPRGSRAAGPDPVSCVEPPTRASRARTGAPPLSIFGSIKTAIFGHPRAKAAPAAPAPAQASATPAAAQAQQPAAPAAAPAGPVDVENVLMVFETERGSADLNWRSSIVDLMKLVGLDSSLDNRKALATELGYDGAKDGSAEMNLWLHKAVMRELEKSGGTVPASLKD